MWRAPALFVFGALSLAAYVACGGDDNGAAPATGGLGQACGAGDVCNPGLECKAAVCVTKSDATTPIQDAAPADTGTDGACSPDLNADPRNCGRCGHACFGGASCRLGTCEASPLVDQLPGPTALATDGTSIFWAERGMPVTATSASVKKCALSGCTGAAQVVASGLPEIPALAVTTTASYFMARDVPPAPHVLYRCPQPGCGVDAGVLESVPSGENAGLSLALQGTSLLYPIERSATEDAGVVRACNAATCPPPIDLLAGLGAPKHVVVTTDKIFVVDQTRILVCPSAGCPVSPPVFAPLTAAVLRVAASDTDLIWLDAKGDISSCPLAGCSGAPKKVLVRNRDQGQSAFFLGMLDGTLYFAETDQPNGPRWLRACKPEQCTATLKNVVSLAGTRPSFVLANKTFYFTSEIAVLRWAP